MRRFAFLGTLAVLGAALFIQACTTREVVGVVVASVSVSPRTASILEGEALEFSATVVDDRGDAISGAEIDWSASDPQKISVQPDGVVLALDSGTVTLNATAHGVSGSATITVVPAPEIGLSPSEVAFSGGVGDPSPPPQNVSVTNLGGGNLVSLAATIDYEAGGPTDWLAVALAATTAPTALTVTPDVSGLGVGSYSATISLSSPSDRNSPVLLPVTLAMTGISVTESSGGTVVSETATVDSFTVVLDSQPASDVVLSVTSGDVGEASVAPATLTFAPADWNVPQAVVVTGVQDAVADGPVQTAVTLSVDDASSDAAFQGVADRVVMVTTTDDDAAGVTVSPTSGLTTSEASLTAQFTVALSAQPTADVTIDLSSSDPGEGTPSPASVTFSPLNWSAPRTVTVTGVNDAIDDGDVPYTIVTAPAASTDPTYAGIDAADVSLTNADDGDTAGIVVAPTSGLTTTETGGQATFTVVLTSEPTADVTLGLSSSLATEGTASPTSLTFTSQNWNIARTVTVASVDDAVADGNRMYQIQTAPATSPDPNYNGVDAADVSVTNIDDETAGITVSPITGPTTEGGGQATFTLVLNNQPSGDVVIGLSSSDTSEGTLSAGSVTFTSLNWSAPQTVTVTGQDDALADGDIAYTIVTAAAASTDPGYDGIDAADVSVTNVDDEATGISVSAPSGPTTEGGGQATFTVVLTSQPSADVSIGLTSSDPSEGALGASTLTFTTSTWNAPQTVTVTGQNDNLADGNVTYEIVTAPATSTDPGYDGLDPADVTLSNVDDETAGITVSAINRPTTEAGGAAQFSVVLNTQPTASVTIGLTSSDTSEGTISASSLTFTTLNWNAAQTVTVTGRNDDVDDGDIVYAIATAPATSADPDYQDLDPADVTVTNTDDDLVGVVATPNGLVTTEAGGTAQFTVRLTSEPLANVTIGLSSSDLAEGVVSTGSLTFTPATWNVSQAVVVTGQDDALADGNVVYTIVTASAVSSDPGYSGLDPANLQATNIDDETAGITVSPASGPTTETGGQATFTVVLNNEPTASVTIGIGSSDTSEGTVSTGSLTFDGTNWSVPQTVTVTGQNDAVDDDNVVYTITTAPAASADPNYSGLDASDVTITNVDDEIAGFAVSPASGPTTESGGTSTFSVALTSQPTANVTVDVSSSDAGEGTLSLASLTFTSATWNVPQTVTVTGADDAFADGNVAFTVVTAPAVSTDAKYAGLDALDVSVTNIDDETVGITVAPASGPTTESGGQATFSVVLNTQPTAAVTIGVASSDTSEGTIAIGSLVFTAATWNVPQTVTVTGQNDDVDDDNVVYAVTTAPASSTDPSYAGIDASDVSITNVDDETAGISVSAASGPTTETAGTATFTVVLASEPLADVTVGLSSSDATEGSVAPTSVTFTAADWSSPRTVTVTGVDDALADGNIVYAIVTAAAVSTDPKYGGLNPADVAVTNVDNETAGITVSSVSGPTTEMGGAATFSVTLNTQPTSDVTVSLASSDATEGAVSAGSLTFSVASWSSAQTVTVTGLDDDVDDDNVVYTIVTAAAVSADPSYSGRNPADVLVTNVDDDDAGFAVSAVAGATTEAGGQATFTVSLTSEPAGNVTVALSSSDLSEGSASPASLTFTSADWATPQTVTVTGQDDALDDDNVVYSVLTAPATSTDPKYGGLDPADVAVTNIDDESTGFVISPASGPTTEAGGLASFTVALTSEPTADVTIGFSSTDTTEGTVSPATLTFTSLNWSVAQVVMVAGQDDALADGNIVYSVVTAPASSTDLRYDNLNPPDVFVTNVDDETAGITVSPASGPTTEAGGQATFTVVLNNQPTAEVTIGLSTSDATEGALSTASLTFTSADWSVPQTVTVTGQDDDVDDDNVVYTIGTSPATSSDPGYGTLDAADVSLTNVDDETAGIRVSPASGPTTEAGGTATFTVVLDSEPTAGVTVGLTSSDTGEGTVSPGSLTFLPSTWDTPQTVTVTGVNDLLADGNVGYAILTAPAVSTDSKYSALDPADVQLTNVDDETPGITVSAPSGPTTETGGTATFTVVLSTQPTAEVDIGLSSSDTSEGTIAVGTLTFTSGNWNIPQTVVVSGQNDDVDDGNVVYAITTAPAVSTDASYNGRDGADVVVTNNDDDAAGFTISPTGIVTTEGGGAATFSVALTSEPTAKVDLGIASSDPTEGSPSTSLLSFTSANWSVAQIVTVTGVDDAVADGNVVYAVLTGPTTSADPKYAVVDPVNVAATNVDDEQAGVTVSPASGPTTETGGQATFSVVLNNQPTGDVTIGLTSSDASEGSLSTGSLTFTSADWNVAQTVTVTGQDDDVDDDNVVYTIVTAPASSTDPAYDGLDLADPLITNIDDETAGITVSPPSGPTTEGGGQATFTIVLDSEPLEGVSIGLSSSDTTEGTLAVGSVDFTAANWSVPQTVTVTGADDALADGNVAYTIVTAAASSSDAKYANRSAADVALTNVDDETAGISVSAISRPTTEAGGTATFTLRLSTQPTADVTIGLSTGDATEGALSTGSLTFTSADWSAPQAVTVTGQDDDVDDGDVTFAVVTDAAVSADGSYDGLDPDDVSVTNTDDETAGISVSPASGPTTEAGGQATFTVVLDSEPTASVAISLSSSDATEGAVSPPSLTFTAVDWDLPQTVTVTGVDDAIADGNVAYAVVTAAATSGDLKYNGLNPANVSLTNVDDETAGFTVSAPSGPTTEAGGTATFTVRLNAQPTADVTVTLSSSDSSEGSVSPTSLTFTAASWSVGQTVTVTGVDDLVDDDNVVYTIVTSAAASTDPAYGGREVPDVLVTNIDDETAGIAVSAPSGPTTEAGGTATFTVVLTSQPSADVSIGLSSSDTSEGQVSPASLTFTSANWSLPQTVTATGQNDALADGNVVYTILTAPATSLSSKYSGMDAADVALTNVDDESVGITVSAVSGPTTEAGGTAQLTVVLNSQPTDDVTIPVSSSDTTEGTIPTGTLTFTSADWSTPQVVVVTGEDDSVDDGNIVFSILLGTSSSADPVYDGLDPADVAVTNVDDDVAGFTVSAITGPTTEAGGTASFTVVLNSQPTADVTLSISSNDTTEGTVSPGSLTFTATDWSVAQTVTVTGVNDAVDDDLTPYTIVTGTAVSGDASYSGLNPPNVSVTNVDDADTAGVTVTPTSGLVTSEAAGAAQFTVVLTSEPTQPVNVLVASSDATEGAVTTPAGGTLTFTAANWSVAQTVTVTGQNDAIDDDAVAYTLVTTTTSSDPKYNGFATADVSATNNDDADTAGFTVSPTSGPTTEAGGAATFTIRLNSEPTADVTIPLSSSDTGEGTVSPASLIFTAANWSTPQTVTVTGVDDGSLVDGNADFTIQTGGAVSADAKYDPLDPADVSVTNTDLDVPGIDLEGILSLSVDESGTQVSFSVVLAAQPLTDVVLGVTSGDTGEITVSTATLTFTTSNWDSPVSVTLTGVDDALDDDDQTVTITVEVVPGSSDPLWSLTPDRPFDVTNVDDDP